MDDFESAFKLVIGAEGGYINDPDDPGGETKYGISKRSYPDLDIANLTMDQVKEIYLVNYWVKAGCGGLTSPMNIYLFDASVNMGINTAKSILARSDYDPLRFLLNRIDWYCELADKKESARKFFRGWINRTIKLYRLLG